MKKEKRFILVKELLEIVKPFNIKITKPTDEIMKEIRKGWQD